MYKPLQEGEIQVLNGLSATKTNGQVLLSFDSYDLHQALLFAFSRQADPDFVAGDEEDGQPKPSVDPHRQFTPAELIDRLPHLSAWQSRHRDYSVGLFLRWLDLAQIDSDPTRVARLQTGLLAFDEVPWIFQEGLEVYVPGGAWGGRLTNVTLAEGFGPPSWRLAVEVIVIYQGVPTLCTTQVVIEYFSDMVTVNSLPVVPIVPKAKEQLASRGAIFKRYATGSHYLSYQGLLSIPGFFGPTFRQASGRLMLDGVTMAAQAPNIARSLVGRFQPVSSQSDEFDQDTLLPLTIGEADTWRCWPSLPAFSFRAKTWGEIQVTGLSPIKFRSDAFDHLVLEQDLKTTIKALVEHSGTAFTDLIDDKSGGLIFLLEGPPGCGKTLTSEAVAESLQRPLYSISVGELGTEPSELESSLRNILEMATRWQAVVLLDEADIFLEKRDEKDLVRNAMVGIFLRLLEYHNGVLFLTTNRVRNIDPAFHSRISISIPYSDLEEPTRLAIWQSLMAAAKITSFDPSPYATYALNGRQIKNVLRLAQTLATAGQVPLAKNHLDKALALVLPQKPLPTPVAESTVSSPVSSTLTPQLAAGSPCGSH